jgi:hypothetical protein
MRGLRSTIALIVVLGGLSAYIYFVTWKTPDKDAATTREKVFPSLKADTIDEIRVKAATGDTTTLKKQDGVWQIAMPVTAKADPSEISSLTNSLGNVDVSRVIEENPADLKDYGLATPRLEIAFKANNDKDFQKLVIGEKSPTGSDVFAQRNGEKRVFLIPAHEETAFNRSTFDFRDKTIVKFDRAKVDGIEVTVDGKTLQFGREGHRWKILNPPVATADTSLMEGLVSRMETTQMKALVTPEATAADLKKYGLDKPAVTVSLNAGSSRTTLLIGDKTKEDTYYARDATASSIVTIEAAFVDNLKKNGVEQYRRKDIFEFRPYSTNRIEITRDTQTVVFEQTKGQDNAPGKWRRVSPNPADVDREKFDSFTTKLSTMRAIAFPEPNVKTGLDKPAMTVQVKFEDTKEEKVTFGKVEGDVYAARTGEATPVQASMADFQSVGSALDEVAK